MKDSLRLCFAGIVVLHFAPTPGARMPSWWLRSFLRFLLIHGTWLLYIGTDYGCALSPMCTRFPWYWRMLKGAFLAMALNLWCPMGGQYRPLGILSHTLSILLGSWIASTRRAGMDDAPGMGAVDVLMWIGVPAEPIVCLIHLWRYAAEQRALIQFLEEEARGRRRLGRGS